MSVVVPPTNGGTEARRIYAMSIQRRKFSKEFKIQVIHEIENGTPVAQISRQHEIQESLIHKWRKLFSALASLAPRPERNQQNPANAFSGNGKISSQESRIAQLERMLGKLYLEKEFLKKTVEHLEMLRSQKS